MENFTTNRRRSKSFLETLSKRSDFVAASKAKKYVGKSIIVQARPNSLQTIRVGYTASKRVGNAVKRNRAKRRMRAAVAETLALYGAFGTDYVLIGREQTTCNTKFEELKYELICAFETLNVKLK